MRRRTWAWILVCGLLAGTLACSQPAPPPPPAPEHARNLILITIDTLRADRVGAYGYARARTPHLDDLARLGTRFAQAFAAAPITLTSHASLMSGRYPPGHGARHNGMRVADTTPLLAETLAAAGFATGGFVAAYPLDRRFGLNRGFATYGDRMPRGAQGRPDNERPGRAVVDEALAWLETQRANRVFLWIHLFEPHAPYGDARTGRAVADRYDDEVAEADAQAGRAMAALGAGAANSLVVVAADHGEAFGEHDEISHSLFVYDTTLRVPLIIAGPGVPARVVETPVSLVDVAPTLLTLLGVTPFDADGIDLSPSFAGTALPERDLYAESFAPLLDFGWSPLRAIRSRGLKFIEAPRAELYDTASDPDEAHDLAATKPPTVAELRTRVERYSTAAIDPGALDRDAAARLQALGYVSSGSRDRTGGKADPKDRRALAARIAQVTSGELHGPALEATLRQIVAEDPNNPLANLRLGYVLAESSRCAAAVPFFTRAIAAHMPSADAHLGLALCQASAGRALQAAATLRDAERVEPDNPVVFANEGMLLSDAGQQAAGIAALQRALAIDPDFHEARFNLARVFGRAGRPQDAAREAADLLQRLPPDAPQRAEVQRLLNAVK